MKQFINYQLKNQTVLWSGADQEKVFKKNLKRNDKEWIYRQKDINYCYNEQGFRERSFNDVDWKESIVIFGCSNVEGVGLANEDTIARCLERIIQKPVINLGIGGTGVDISCWNSTILYEYYDIPKAIIHIWSNLDRYSDTKNDKIVPYVPRSSKYCAVINWEFRSRQYVITDRALWRDKTLYYEASFFGTTASRLKIDKLNTIDYARDLIHPGLESTKLVAEKIAENLYKQGL